MLSAKRGAVQVLCSVCWCSCLPVYVFLSLASSLDRCSSASGLHVVLLSSFDTCNILQFELGACFLYALLSVVTCSFRLRRLRCIFLHFVPDRDFVLSFPDQFFM